jgi:site-specific DNA recombinase
MRAALYLRVSTPRQAEKDLSIPDQRQQAAAYCRHKGWNVVAEYVEPGASATDDKRPAFQRMIDEACSQAKSFDAIVIHSFSRFFRDAFLFEFYRRKLDKNGVRLFSITQETPDDPMGHMIRQVATMFDEYNSRENAKHVLRAMKENARQGFWNGGPPPYGCRSYVAETRGDAAKKKLEIDPVEAQMVREIFDMFLKRGLGVRAIAAHLNARGLRYRNSRPFRSSVVHKILTRATCTGRHYFNRNSGKKGTLKDRGEWVEIATPVIIDPDIFVRTQRVLESRRPCNTPPRVVNGPTLLVGLAKCVHCGRGMTLRTGKSGRYRYYTCNAAATEGKTACKGHNIRMELLDSLVIDHLAVRLFTPARLEALTARLIERTTQRSATQGEGLSALRRQLNATESKIQSLYQALAERLVTDSSNFRTSLAKFEQQQEDLIRKIADRTRQRDLPRNVLSARNLERFSSAVQGQLRNGDKAFRRSYLRAFVGRIDVGEREIRIRGSKAALIQGIVNSQGTGNGPVPSSVPQRWAGEDSNLQLHRYERRVLTN